MYKTVVSRKTYQFKNLKVLMAKATPLRSGDILAGVAANTQEERVAAQMALAEVPLKRFLETEIKSWLRIILETAAVISGVIPSLILCKISVVVFSESKYSRNSPTVKLAIG